MRKHKKEIHDTKLLLKLGKCLNLKNFDSLFDFHEIRTKPWFEVKITSKIRSSDERLRFPRFNINIIYKSKGRVRKNLKLGKPWFPRFSVSLVL